MATGFNCLTQQSRLSTFTSHLNLCDVTAGSDVINPEIGTAVSSVFVDERVPVDVTDMTVAAGSNKSNRNDALSLPVISDVFASRQ